MPRYRNDTEQSITPLGHRTVPPSGILDTRRYLANRNGLTKISDMEPPWDLFTYQYNELPVSVEDLARYPQLIIQNETDVEIRFNVNNADPDIGIGVPSSGVWPIDQDCEIDQIGLTQTGATTGRVTIIAMRR